MRCVKGNKEWELTEKAKALIQMHKLMEGGEKKKQIGFLYFIGG